MRKLINISLAVILAFILGSCSENIMDNINKDQNDASDVASKLIITDAMTSTAFNIVGSDLAFYASVYIEHNVGVYGQFYNAEARLGDTYSSTTYNNSWDYLYANLLNLKTVINKCSTGGSEEGNYVTLGVAQILTAYNLAVLTDVMGDTPWSEALQPGVIYTPVLDKQADIYADVFTLLNDAIENLDKTTLYASLGSQDFIYGGDASLWKKFAYGLKARYTMRLSLRTPDYANVIAYADQSFASAADQAKFVYNGTTSINPWYEIFIDRNYFGASQSLHDKLAIRNDPRDAIFWKVYPGTSGALVFAPNGTPNQVQKYYSVSKITAKTSPTYLMSYHELQFLKAEAYVRLGGAANLSSAEDALIEGITAAFGKVNIGLSSTAAMAYYVDDVKARFDANPLSEVMNQKYIAFYEEEALEAYNDYRRLKGMGDNVITLENPKNDNEFPLRYAYGSEDVTTNKNVATAYGDGKYVYTEPVWWAGGTR
jgi:hypothetical protein